MANEFWLSAAQWAAIDPLLPKNRPGARRVDDRRVISGIVHVLRVGCRWQDCPACYGPPTTIYNLFHRWSARGLWQKLFRALATANPNDVHMIDSTTAKAHRSAAGGKGGGGTGDWALARWAHDQNPRRRRRSGPTARHREVRAHRMVKAYEVLGDVVALRGNVSPSLLTTGTPGEVDAAVRHLAENVFHKGGKLILDAAFGLPDETPIDEIAGVMGVFGDPCEGINCRIDLIVIVHAWEWQQFRQVAVEPIRPFRK
jgi:transposase